MNVKIIIFYIKPAFPVLSVCIASLCGSGLECNFKLIKGFYSVHMNWLLLKYQITLI